MTAPRRCLLVALAFAVIATGDAAASTYVAIPGARGPGLARYDRVFVDKYGPASARRVLILVPGYLGAAGDFSLIAPELVAHVPNMQVWALDRREVAFEDPSVFRTGNPLAAYNFYLPGAGSPGAPHSMPLDSATVPFARRWGLPLALADLRRVVLAAKHGGRRVILGGHSLGASTALAYAAWDFNGRPGYKDISGLVLIDGGLLGTFSHPSLSGVRRRLAALERGDPFVDLLGLHLPWATGVFAELAALYAKRQPDAPSVLEGYPLLPADLRPAVRVTNAALLGFAFDAATSPRYLDLAQVHAGHLAPSGDPRPWDDAGAMTPIARLAALFSHEPGNAVEWYFPERLTLDVDGADALERNAITRLLGLRLFHRRGIDVPLYVFETSLTHGRVLRGARRLIASSHIPRSKLVSDPRTSHLDPLTALPSRNRFLQTVEPFLRGLH